MDMNLLLPRGPSSSKSTTSELFIDGEYFCYTLEDVVREIVGRPVSEWKIFGETAIPAGRYELTFVNSPHFGPDTIRVNNVPGYTGVDMHSGTSATDTEGCIIVGDSLNWDNDTIAGGRRDGILLQLKAELRPVFARADRAWILITNP